MTDTRSIQQVALLLSGWVVREVHVPHQTYFCTDSTQLFSVSQDQLKSAVTRTMLPWSEFPISGPLVPTGPMNSPHREAVCRTCDTYPWLWQNAEPCSVPSASHSIRSCGCLKLPRMMMESSLDQDLFLIDW